MSGQRAVEVARDLVVRLLALGVREAVLAPGSRSGPLALALHAADAQGLVRLNVRVDEREAGFLALGMARASRRCVPVVTTSGTAVANLHPALLEALHADVPVVAVTADRPARLRGTGANQTTDQRRILPGVPFLERVDDLVGGPAHLNLELDEPLVEDVEWDFAGRPSDDEVAWSGSAATVPSATLAPGRTVVVAGDGAGRAARVLARENRWPLLAEPTSGARTGGALTSYRLLLDQPHLADRVERVVSFGHPTLSRPVTRLLARDDVDVVHVGTQATFPVPAGARTTFSEDVDADPGDPAWLREWEVADRAVTAAVDHLVDTDPDAEPLRVARAVGRAVPPHGLLFVGASHPVRDLDLVARPHPVGERRLVLANRGLAGIDGTLSSAIGAALARPSARAVALVGDLTFLHGANGLLLGPDEPRPDLTVVVVNDDGGSIFAGLEQGGAGYAGPFERVYATPTGTDLAALCRAHGVAHRRLDAAALPAALEEEVGGLRVLEVPVGRAGRRDLAARIGAVARAAVER